MYYPTCDVRNPYHAKYTLLKLKTSSQVLIICLLTNFAIISIEFALCKLQFSANSSLLQLLHFQPQVFCPVSGVHLKYLL